MTEKLIVMREAFEAWAEREFGKAPGSLPATERFASYWKCWQAALAQQDFPARFFASGPQGCAWFDDLSLASAMISAFDKDDDWTITDTGKMHAAPKRQAVDDEMPDEMAEAIWRSLDPETQRTVTAALLAALPGKTEVDRG